MPAYHHVYDTDLELDTIRERADEFLSSRRFKRQLADTDYLIYKRGSKWLNFIALRPNQLLTTVTLQSTSKANGFIVDIHYAVETIGQFITPQENVYFEAEFISLLYYLDTKHFNLRLGLLDEDVACRSYLLIFVGIVIIIAFILFFVFIV